jgi:environmental stress-induced protein Ves
MLKITRLVDCPFIPWKNMGGVTQELYRSGDNPFRVRISVAKVSSSGPFSLFPEHQRELILLKGNLELNISGKKKVLSPFIPFSFSGNELVDSTLIDGEVQDFNVITLNGVRVHVEIIEFHERSFEIHYGQFLYVADGEVEFNDQRYSETLFEGSGFVFPKLGSRAILLTVGENQ